MTLIVPIKALEEKWRKEDHDLAIENLRTLLATNAGKEYLWYVLDAGDVFDSIWDPGAKIHYNAGRQDYARGILRDIGVANPEALQWMMIRAQTVSMAREKEKQEALKGDAA